MNKEEILVLLEEFKVCSAAIKWVESSSYNTVEEFWLNCERVDWMIWVLTKMAGKKGYPSHQNILKCLYECTKEAIDCIPYSDDLIDYHFRTIKQWMGGNATDKELYDMSAKTFRLGQKYEDENNGSEEDFASQELFYAISYLADYADLEMRISANNCIVHVVDAYKAGYWHENPRMNYSNIRKRIQELLTFE